MAYEVRCHSRGTSGSQVEERPQPFAVVAPFRAERREVAQAAACGCLLAERLPSALDHSGDPARQRPVAVVAPGYPLRIVSQPEGQAARPWFERALPMPREDAGPGMEPDLYLKGLLQNPDFGPAFYHKEVARRQQMEEENKDYTFFPLLITLRNMERLVDHLLAGRQFAQPLAADEYQAFVELQGLIRQMIKQMAPYKRTVQLAVLMNTLLEIVTARHVLDELRTATPEREGLVDRLALFSFYSQSEDAGEAIWLKASLIPLERVLSCRWGGLRPQAARDETQELLACWPQVGRTVGQWLDSGKRFLYPTFAPLEPADLCRLDHLPVYPLAMTCRYACQSQGVMHAPLAFLEHNLSRVHCRGPWLHLAGEQRIEGMDGRLLFRQLVLDNPPRLPEGLDIRPAVELLLFDLFYNEGQVRARRRLEHASFLPLFQRLCQARRERRDHHRPACLAIGDQQAFIACRWVHWVYRQWSRHHYDPVGPHRVLGNAFFGEEMPPVLGEWRFFDRHREAIRAFLASVQRLRRTPDGQLQHCYPSQSDWVRQFCHSGELVFFEERSAHGAGPIDHTDLAYFDVLTHPALRDQLLRLLAD